jgi:apolipoprotein N-acyltransferase
VGALLRVSLVQANIPEKLKWQRSVRQAALDKYLRLTRCSAGRTQIN